VSTVHRAPYHPTFSVVMPTVGRPSLQQGVDALAASRGPLPLEVILVDDRRRRDEPLRLRTPGRIADRTMIIPGTGAGPAAARNVGWRASHGEWVAFLDDDVTVGPDWFNQLAADLAGADDDVVGVQGRVAVPLPADRLPTDWERNVAGLADARWITADIAYRQSALDEVGGFDERFRRAYREDADLALRLLDAGHRLVRGGRDSAHPVRPAPWWISLRAQAGNADDPLMRRLHGPDWRRRAAVPRGRRPAHLATTAALAGTVLSALTGRRRLATLLAAAWAAATVEFTLARVRPGPGTPGEVAAMAATSTVLPAVATAQWLRGLARAATVRRPAQSATSQ